jgi:hypothetical protein
MGTRLGSSPQLTGPGRETRSMSRFSTFIAIAGGVLVLAACATSNAGHAGAQRQQGNPVTMNVSEGGGGGGY